MQPLINDATSALLRAVRRRLADAGAGSVHFEEIRSRSWASVTFTGARHDLGLRIDGEEAEAAADAFADGLEAAEFRLRGHIVADIALVSQSRSAGPSGAPRVALRIEALTVEDA